MGEMNLDVLFGMESSHQILKIRALVARARGHVAVLFHTKIKVWKSSGQNQPLLSFKSAWKEMAGRSWYLAFPESGRRIK